MPDAARSTHLRRLPTAALTSDEIAAVRSIMDAAFGTSEEAFGEADWDHAIGGLHFVLDLDGEIVAHASVVERTIEIGGRSLRTGYVEAVATAPSWEGQGFGSLLMEAATAFIRDTFELGALGTGRHRFYERLGWLAWQGRAFVRQPNGPQRTPEDEGCILVLRTPRSPAFDLTEPITCGWRSGDAW